MSVGIYIDPPSKSLLQDRFFTQSISSLARCLGFVKATLERQGIRVHTVDRLPPPGGAERNLLVTIGSLATYPSLADRSDLTLSAFMVTESPIVDPHLYLGLSDVRRRFKRLYSCIDQADITEFVGAEVSCIPLRWPIDFHGVDMPLWSRSERGFLAMINMNKLPRLASYELFTERMRAVEFLSRSGDIDLYGVGWNKASMQMGRSRLPWTLRRAHIALRDWIDRIHPDPLLVAARKVYKGELDTKWETLSKYDFLMCFENTRIGGWVTEKIFESFRVGAIPIYWGANDIAELIPPDAFIDMRQFAGYAELLAFLKGLSRDDIRRYRDAGRAFLESRAFEPFSRERFAEIFRDILEQDAGVRITL